MYADDTKLYKANRDLNDCALMQCDLDSIYEWAYMWQLHLNPSKTKHLRIGSRINSRFVMNGMRIDTVESIRDIGIHIQSNLRFTVHCSRVVQKAHYCIRKIFHAFKGHTADFYIILYTTYVRPLLESGSPVWSPHLIGNIDKVESVQQYFTRRLPGYANLPYCMRLELLDLEMLESRRVKFDIILYFKVEKNLVYIDIAESLRPQFSHRGHNKNLYHFFSRTNVRKFFWSNRIVKHWNKLSSSTVNCKSVESFKKHVKPIVFKCWGSIY